MCFLKKFRCLNAKNLGSVGQRATKLLAVKVGVLKKKSATLPIPAEVSASAYCEKSSFGHSLIQKFKGSAAF